MCDDLDFRNSSPMTKLCYSERIPILTILTTEPTLISTLTCASQIQSTHIHFPNISLPTQRLAATNQTVCATTHQQKVKFFRFRSLQHASAREYVPMIIQKPSFFPMGVNGHLSRLK